MGLQWRRRRRYTLTLLSLSLIQNILCLSLASLPRLDSPEWGGALLSLYFYSTQAWLERGSLLWTEIGRSGDKLCLAKASSFIGKSRSLWCKQSSSCKPTLHNCQAQLLRSSLFQPLHHALFPNFVDLVAHFRWLSSFFTWLGLSHGYGPINSPPPCPWEENVFW